MMVSEMSYTQVWLCISRTILYGRHYGMQCLPARITGNLALSSRVLSFTKECFQKEMKGETTIFYLEKLKETSAVLCRLWAERDQPGISGFVLPEWPL